LRFAEAAALARTASEHLELAKRLADTAPLAGAAERAQNLARAQDHFKQAIELAPDPAFRRAALIRFLGYFESDNPARRAEADAFFKSAEERYSTEPAPYLVRASLLHTEKTMDAYVEAIRRVGMRFPKDTEVRALVATALRDKIRLNPKTPEPQQRTLLAEARTELDAALKLNPEDQLALLTKALVLRDLAGLEKDAKRAAALEAEAQRLIDQQTALEARKPK
jgi:tetratricopeptide (TPR) repeat protein